MTQFNADAETRELMASHDLDSPREHTDLQVAGCACRRPNISPANRGDSCATCGGINMVPSGSCLLCQDCGTSGGCS